jgi:GDPmannose 4,6-dehydratase
MAALSNIPESFNITLTIFEINTMAVISILENIRAHSPHTRFFQAGTSEQIGDNDTKPQNTDSMMLPNNPYGIAKLASFNIVRMYRKKFGLFAVNGMLWNHEGPRRGPTFVTRKITLHIKNQLGGSKEPLQIGNLDSCKDWGLAEEYCDAIIMMTETDKADDYAVNTGELHSIREFIEEAYKHVNITVEWRGDGKKAKGYNKKDKSLLVEVNENYYRPIESNSVPGDHSKIQKKLGWKPKVKFKELVRIMMESELQ